MGWTMVDRKQDSVDLTTAAGILGLSVETLRKRLQRGTIAGFKAPDGTWRVVLNKPPLDKTVLDRSGRRRQAKPRPAARSRADNVLDNTLSTPGQDHSDLVAALRDEVQFLRSQLQARDEEIRRFQVLLQQHQQPARALPDHSGDWMQNWMRLWLWWLSR